MLKLAAQRIVNTRLASGEFDGVTIREGIQAQIAFRLREKPVKMIQYINR